MPYVYFVDYAPLKWVKADPPECSVFAFSACVLMVIWLEGKTEYRANKTVWEGITLK